ncbi:MAG: hypothetical protein JRE88_06600 [Deltaproteobacteria bacterium]|jgi:TM2 domain-containing membrane protein YozV|nr:hypothetical protein [Deltaproteobacteria bacterium]
MKASTRGMLLSGLVYPGIGQLLAGHKRSGLIFVLGTSVGLIVLFYRLMQRAYRLMEQAIPRLADEALDFQALKELVAHSSSGGWGVELICLIGITGCWLAAVVHAYVVGRKINSHL